MKEERCGGMSTSGGLRGLIGIFNLGHFLDLSNAKTAFVLIKQLKTHPRQNSLSLDEYYQFQRS